jgi:hypothetical protein
VEVIMRADKRAIDELNRVLGKMEKEAKDTGKPLMVRDFDDVGTSDDGISADGEGMLAPLIIGMRGALTRQEARRAASAWRKIRAKMPRAEIYPSIAGYGTDSREVWEIEEARRFFCQFARFAGIRCRADVERAGMHESVLGVLAKCGAIEDMSPDEVEVTAWASGTKH